MKTILLAIVSVLFLSLGGCVEATVSVGKVALDHNGDPSFTFTVPACPPQYAAYCPATVPATTVPLPGFTQKIGISLPAGASASAHVTELDVRDTNGNDLSFIQSLTVEVSTPDKSTFPFKDYVNTGYGPALQLIPTSQDDLVPYIEADLTTFTITLVVAGPTPTQDMTFALDVSVYVSLEASYEKSL